MVRYKQLLSYVTLVINNNNIHLIDNQYGVFAGSNELGFTYTKQGRVVLEKELSGEKRYLLQKKLKNRWIYSSTNKLIVERLNTATIELIEKMEDYLVEED